MLKVVSKTKRHIHNEKQNGGINLKGTMTYSFLNCDILSMSAAMHYLWQTDNNL